MNQPPSTDSVQPDPELTQAGCAPAPQADFSADGGCACRYVRYRIHRSPFIVHACHCRWCQRETGSAFVINGCVESDQVELLHGEINTVVTPSESGAGQKIVRCPQCHVAVWSHYRGGGAEVSFVRIGTLDNPDAFAPDIHIYTASKQPWLVLPEGSKAVPAFYNPAEVWPEQSLLRWRAAKGL